MNTSRTRCCARPTDVMRRWKQATNHHHYHHHHHCTNISKTQSQALSNQSDWEMLKCLLSLNMTYLINTVIIITTATCSAPPTVRPMAHFRVHSAPGVSSMKQKTLQYVLEWSSQAQEFQVGRQPTLSTGAATEKSLSPIFRLVLGTTGSQLVDERSDDREGI